MAEWLKAHAWKACLGETLTWVRIPLSPPRYVIDIKQLKNDYFFLGAMILTFSTLSVRITPCSTIALLIELSFVM